MSNKISYRQRHAYDTVIGDIALRGDKVARGFKSWPVTECTAELALIGDDGTRVTASRVIAGTLLAGPVGAIVGGLAKKSKDTGYLIIKTPSGEQTIPVSGGKVNKAKKFMMCFETVQARNLNTAEGA